MLRAKRHEKLAGSWIGLHGPQGTVVWSVDISKEGNSGSDVLVGMVDQRMEAWRLDVRCIGDSRVGNITHLMTLLMS